MQLLFSTDGQSLDAPINPRFGRAVNFMLVDSQSGDFKCVSNPGSAASGGAGVTAAEEAARLGAEAVLTGSVGPNASAVLSAAGIAVYSDQAGTIHDVVARFNAGALTADAAAEVNDSDGTDQNAAPALPADSRRIAISAEGQGLLAPVGAHFGRAPYFVLIDLQGKEVKQVNTVPNPFAQNHQPGQVPGFIHAQEAHVMLSGGMGARAVQLFSGYGIEVATGAGGTIQDALNAYVAGHLRGTAPCTDHAHGCSH